MNHDSALSRVKVVLVSAECSRTSVADPIELLIQEGQPDSNMSQLLNLKPQGSEKSADALGGKHAATLRTAMSGLIPNSNAIVYGACGKKIYEKQRSAFLTWAQKFLIFRLSSRLLGK